LKIITSWKSCLIRIHRQPVMLCWKITIPT
jgi:hypothetical protein